MDNRERVLTALNHKQPDKVPYCITFTEIAREKMVDFYCDEAFESKLGNCFTILESDPAWAWQEVKPNVWQDQFGVFWDRSVDRDIGVVCNTLVNKDNYADFPFPDPGDPSRFALYKPAVKQNPDGFFVVDLGWTLFERAWTLAGMENILMAFIADKKFVEGFLDRITEWNLQMIDNICAFDIDAIWFGDDWGQQRSLIMGPEMWREFFKPRIRTLFQRVKSHGKQVFLHSCGKVDELFDDLIECGLDLFNPFQPEVINVFQIKQQYGDRLNFWGGISTQRTLPFGTVDQVKDEVRQMIDKVGKGGGYIAAPAHDIPADAKPENIAAMIEVLQKQ